MQASVIFHVILAIIISGSLRQFPILRFTLVLDPSNKLIGSPHNYIIIIFNIAFALDDLADTNDQHSVESFHLRRGLYTDLGRQSPSGV